MVNLSAEELERALNKVLIISAVLSFDRVCGLALFCKFFLGLSLKNKAQRPNIKPRAPNK